MDIASFNIYVQLFFPIQFKGTCLNYLLFNPLRTEVTEYLVLFFRSIKPRIRDRYGEDSGAMAWGIHFIIGDLIAQGMNSTLIGRLHPCFIKGGTKGNNWKLATYPRYLPDVLLHNKEKINVNDIWKIFLKKFINNSTVELPTFNSVEQVNSNFVYCDISQKMQISVWKFSLFTDPFDVWVWWLLLLALILVSLLAHSNGGSISKGPTFSPSFFFTLSTLLSSEITIQKPRSNLLILWSFSCLMLTEIYSGEMTGEVIKPAEEIVLTRLWQIERMNYTLMHLHTTSQNVLSSFLDGATCKDCYTNKETLILKKLVTRAKPAFISMLDNYVKNVSILEFVKKKKVVLIEPWTFAMERVITGNMILSANRNVWQSKRCYIGQESIRMEEIFHIFLPPKSVEGARIFQNLMATGVIQRWHAEFRATQYSKRVQDRIKVKSPVSVEKEKVNEAEKLAFTGKTLTLFLLWGLCILGSLLSLFGELILSVIGTKNDSAVRLMDFD